MRAFDRARNRARHSNRDRNYQLGVDLSIWLTRLGLRSIVRLEEAVFNLVCWDFGRSNKEEDQPMFSIIAKIPDRTRGADTSGRARAFAQDSGSRLSQPTRHFRGAFPARWPHRRHRPNSGAGPVRSMGPASCRRKPPRCRLDRGLETAWRRPNLTATRWAWSSPPTLSIRPSVTICPTTRWRISPPVTQVGLCAGRVAGQP